ncbi:restriction endonuclease subunit S [Nitrosomonas sp.]|uniref:restriction endonuclease subunit S n=1 Tax=Nitrosomonas sp. TaxID=42353 RepID=UPI001D4576C7|nr:restriction endonuclease subunit S [Nitrosomonas sp.]MBX9637665.1 restriction endonuclease subunit S [Nitrosomonas sp.]MBY0483850.1 restriction endonuclease subunit S [Nitrosomonas sp.]
MSSFTKDLHKTWELTTLGEVYQVIGGGTPSTEIPGYWDGDIPWITSADIEGVRQINIRKYVTEKGISGSTTNRVPAKTLLVVTRVGLGKIAIAEEPICFSQDLQGLIQNPKLIFPEYTLYLLSYKLQFLKFDGRGTTISGITKKQLKDLDFPLPPLREQYRIVAKIEELFSELDKGIENLKTAQSQLKVYRQALLKHAFEGKLTAQWRAERNVTPAKAGAQPLNDMDSRLRGNDKPLETAEALLKRIQQERAQRYQQQLADWEKSPSIPLLQRGKPASTAHIPPLEKGGRGGISKPKPPKSLPPLTAEELAGLPELPEGWGWVKYGELTVGSQNGISKRSGETGRELVVLRLADITDQKISLDNPRKILLTENEINNYRLFKNDLICIRVNGSADLVGRIISIKEDMEVAYCDHFIRYRLLNKIISPIYLQHFFNTLSVRRYVELNKVSSAGQNTVNQEMLGSVLVAICGAEEQEVIVELLDTQLSETDQLDQTITTSLQQAEALRQSILKKAFSGQLVPQDPNDEPASALLTRIKAERADTALKTKRKTT